MLRTFGACGGRDVTAAHQGHKKAAQEQRLSLEMPNDNIDGYAVAHGVNYLTSFSHLCGKEPGAVFELCLFCSCAHNSFFLHRNDNLLHKA